MIIDIEDIKATRKQFNHEVPHLYREAFDLLLEAVSKDPPPDLEARLTAAVRHADLDFESVGGSSRHYVRECLLPALEAAKLRIVDA